MYVYISLFLDVTLAPQYHRGAYQLENPVVTSSSLFAGNAKLYSPVNHAEKR